MMARIGRIAGALLAETRGAYFLIGNTKEPCDFAAWGFERPAEIDAVARPYLRLRTCGPVEIRPPWLVLDIEGEALAEVMTERFMIERNGSVSERLWRLVTNPHARDDGPAAREIPAAWLGEMPGPVWQIVRDTVLRCA